MAETVSVSVSGPALSFLLYENVKCPGNQVGFLLGAVMNHVTDTISDSHMTNETMETLINIHSVMPFYKQFPFYNGLGRVDRNKLKAFVKDREKEVVGWYCFRRGTPLVPLMRDRLLHKELSSAMTHFSPEVFTMCLLGSAVLKPAIGCTHSFSHKFFRYCHRSFKPLSVNIQNLGGTTQSEYKMVPSIACTSDTFNNIVDSVRSSYRDSSPKDLMLHMQQALQDHLQNLITDVESVESDIIEVEKQISNLRAHVGSVPNEILLPQLLKQDTSTANIIDLQPAVYNEVTKPASKPMCDNSGKLIINQTETKKEPNYSVSLNKNKRDPSPSSSYDPFSFTSEMKIDVGSSKSPVLGGCNRPIKGFGRGQRKKQVSGEVGGELPEGPQTRRKPSGRAQMSPAKETIIPISVEDSMSPDLGKSSPPRRRSSPSQSSPSNTQCPGKPQQPLHSNKKNSRAGREGQSTELLASNKVTPAKGSGTSTNRTPRQKTPSPEVVVASPKQMEPSDELSYNNMNENTKSPRVVLVPVKVETDSPRTRQRSQLASRVSSTCSTPRTLAQVVSGSERQEQ